MTTIVVEGIGDVVTKPTGYGRALRKLLIDKEHANEPLRVIFADVCSEWLNYDQKTREERENTRNRLMSWGAEFLDKSGLDPAQKKEYDELARKSVDAVFVATPDRHHIKVAKHWLKGNCKRVFIEKPLSNDPVEAKRWIGELRRKDTERLMQLDHYYLKVHSQFRYEEHMRTILAAINKRTIHIRFYLLEDHSGLDEAFLASDPKYRDRRDQNGPIEIEGRTETLADGLSLDLLPHLLALLKYFGDPRTFEVTKLCPARYKGVRFDDDISAGIRGETFAAVEFAFTDNKNHPRTGEAYIGKGIRGSIRYPGMNGNVKLLELQGDFGPKIEFDFINNVASVIRKSGSEYLHPEPLVDLEPDPYYYLLRNVALKTMYMGTDLGIPITTGAIILDKIVSQISSHTKDAELETYKLGNREGRLPPMLEDLLPGGTNEIRPLPINFPASA